MFSKIARRRIMLAPSPRTMSACPVCKSTSGFCLVSVTFTPRQWWGARRSPSK
jgi:hypothetical protein